MRGPLKTVLCYVFAVAFVLAGWQVTSLVLDTPALPGPLETVGVFAKHAASLGPDFLTSLGRLVVSLALGCVLGVPVGLFLGRSQKAGALFSPVLYLLYPLPKIVLLPILLVLFGLGGVPKIALVTITVFFQVVVVMRDAAASIPPATLLSVRSLGASRLQEWRYVVLPATLPELFTTLRVSTSVAIAVLFFSESIAGSTGLGYFIMNSWAMVNYPRMFAGIIALAALGCGVYAVFDACEHAATRWRQAGNKA